MKNGFPVKHLCTWFVMPLLYTRIHKQYTFSVVNMVEVSMEKAKLAFKKILELKTFFFVWSMFNR